MAIKQLSSILASVIFISSCASQQQITEPLEEILFKNFVLALCMGKAFKETETAIDANKAANGYMETGHMPFEAYATSSRLVDTWLKRNYESKSGGQIQTMKCIELYRSPELKVLYDRHTPCSNQAGWPDSMSYRAQCEE